MAGRRSTNWLLANLPKAIYIALTIGGVVFIWIAKSQAWSASFTIGVPAGLIGAYFLMSALLAGFRVHDEQAGDNLYYMGFLFTLTSLGVSLYRYNAAESIDGIVRDFGLAVVTTICGIGLRIFYNQVRRDPIDIERTARHELAEMTRRVRTELEAASREFADFRRVSNQMLEEGFEEIGRQAQRSGQHILKMMESLTQEAVRPVREAGEQIKTVLDDVGNQADARFGSAADRMESATQTFEHASARMTDILAIFGRHVEAAGTRLSEVKTPDEVISIKLRPTLKTLEKLVAAQTQRLDTSDARQAQQLDALRQTQQAIDHLVGAVARSVETVERAIDVAARSHQASESLGRLVEQQTAEIRSYLKGSGEQATAPAGPRPFGVMPAAPEPTLPDPRSHPPEIPPRPLPGSPPRVAADPPGRRLGFFTWR